MTNLDRVRAVTLELCAVLRREPTTLRTLMECASMRPGFWTTATTNAFHMSIAPTPLDHFTAALFAGDLPSALAAVQRSLDEGTSPADVHCLLIEPALYRVGDAWERAQIGVSDEHVATAIAERALADLFPRLVGRNRGNGPRVVLSVVPGEAHQIGLRMVADVLEGAGYRVVVLRPGASMNTLVELVRGLRPAAVGLSVSSSGLVPNLVAAVRAMREHSVPVVVGGRAVPPSLKTTNGLWVARRSSEAAEKVSEAIELAGARVERGGVAAALARVRDTEGATRDANAQCSSELAELEGDSLRALHRGSVT
jgi:methanogenic corrinoid protein MtbC1